MNTQALITSPSYTKNSIRGAASTQRVLMHYARRTSIKDTQIIQVGAPRVVVVAEPVVPEHHD